MRGGCMRSIARQERSSGSARLLRVLHDRAGRARCVGCLASANIKKINLAGFEGIFGTDDEQALVLDELLKNLRAVAQLVHRHANIRSAGLANQLIRTVAESGRQERFDGWANPVDDRAQVFRLIKQRALQLIDRRRDRSALRVPCLLYTSDAADE